MGRMTRSNLSYSEEASLAGSLSGSQLSPMDQPVTPSTLPSIHQPSRTLRLGTPFSAAFMPLVPDASNGFCGVFSHRSTPEQTYLAKFMSYSSRYTTLTLSLRAAAARKMLRMSLLPPSSSG